MKGEQRLNEQYFNDLLSKHQCDFRQGYGAQNYCLAMIEKLRKSKDKKGISIAELKDSSKDFNCISHSLPIAKLSAHGFYRKSLIFMQAYFKNKKQKSEIGSAFSGYLVTSV